MRLLTSTASVRTRNLEKHLLWPEMLTPHVAERLGDPDADLRALTMV